METGVFDRSPINSLEFETDAGVRAVPLPDQLPPPPNLSHLSKDILKSAAVENLLAQNEELMARLKVALRRLSTLENENQKIDRAAQEMRQRLTIAEDRTLVLREKDQVWKERAEDIARKAEVLQEKIRILEEKQQDAEAEITRHRKYHDRIKTQVKPHLMQLKEYARGLESRIQDLEGEIGRRESQVRELRGQIVEVVKNSRIQVESTEVRLHEAVESYEKTTSAQREELEIARANIADLEAKALRMRRAEQRCDELENEAVELRRTKDELSNRFETECRRLMERSEELSREGVRLKIENEDLRVKALSDYDRLRELEKQNLDQQSQLESLRYLYNQRSEENDRLKLALGSLEKLNVDLSARIQELRTSSSVPVASERSPAPTN